MIKIVDVPIYSAKLVFTTTRKEAVEQISKFFEDKEKTICILAAADALAKDDGLHYFIFAEANKIDDVAHEAVHTANRILTNAGIKITQRNDEALAYLVGYIMKVFMDKEGWTNGKKLQKRVCELPREAGADQAPSQS